MTDNTYTTMDIVTLCLFLLLVSILLSSMSVALYESIMLMMRL